MLKQAPSGQGKLKERILQGERWKEAHRTVRILGREGSARGLQGPGDSNYGSWPCIWLSLRYNVWK